MADSIGTAVRLTLFGESHGPAVGAVLEGIAPGTPIDEAAVADAMEPPAREGEDLHRAQRAGQGAFSVGRVQRARDGQRHRLCDRKYEYAQRRL